MVESYKESARRGAFFETIPTAIRIGKKSAVTAKDLSYCQHRALHFCPACG